MVKKVKVDQSTCIGCGTCAAMCSAVFSIHDDGKAQVDNSAGASEAEIQAAIDACPVRAISWEE